MKRALFFVLLSAVPVGAQETTPAPVAPSATAPAVLSPGPLPPANSPSFLAERGVVSSDELVQTLNAQLTPGQRARLDEALAKRNAALTKANDELSATLRELLGETDAGLTRRVDESAEAKRMDRLRRLQPSRYQELMNRKKKEQKNQQGTSSTDH